jgi:hypothetical protein
VTADKAKLLSLHSRYQVSTTSSGTAISQLQTDTSSVLLHPTCLFCCPSTESVLALPVSFTAVLRAEFICETLQQHWLRQLHLSLTHFNFIPDILIHRTDIITLEQLHHLAPLPIHNLVTADNDAIIDPGKPQFTVFIPSKIETWIRGTARVPHCLESLL